MHTAKWFFNICNSLAFVALSLFMYDNVERKKKYDTFVYLLIHLFLWIFAFPSGLPEDINSSASFMASSTTRSAL